MSEIQVDRLVKKIEDSGITPYEIAKNTSLTQSAIGRILSGEVKRPHCGTVREILDYLDSKASNVVSEPGIIYHRKISDLDDKADAISILEKIKHKISDVEYEQLRGAVLDLMRTVNDYKERIIKANEFLSKMWFVVVYMTTIFSGFS
jgi:predicted transcriptional regulator